MKRSGLFVGLAVLSFGFSAVCDATELRMRPINPDNNLNLKIIGGNPALKSDWPVTLVFANGSDQCTATIVGEQVVLTAAHCVGSADQVFVNATNEWIELICQRHPRYVEPRPGKPLPCRLYKEPEDIVSCTADVAICLRKDGQDFPASVGTFERVKNTPPATAAHKEVQLLGYGCLAAGGKMNETVQIGHPLVAWVSAPGSSSNPKDTYHEFIKTDGSGALCDGDSGGSAYTSTDQKHREIIAVASRGNLSTDSYLVNVLDPTIIEWLRHFSPAAIICGLHADARNCTF